MIDKLKELAKPNALKTYDLSFLKSHTFGGWSLEEDTCRFIGRVCETFRPRRVLEFGTGLSTCVLAHEAARGNVEKVWSVDHLADFPGHPRDILFAGRQHNFINFRRFPIRLTYLAGRIFQLYSIPEDFFNETGLLDLVIIDGPPYYYNGREAVLYLTYPHVAPHGLILLDDAERKNREQTYIKKWKQYFGHNIDSIIFLDSFKKGLACLWPTGLKETAGPATFKQRSKDSCISLWYECLRILRRAKRCRL